MRWESENEQGITEMFPRFAVAGREVQSFDPTVLSETQSRSIQPALSDPNLLMVLKGMELRDQSRSLFARSTEVRDLVDNFKGLGLAG